MRTPGFTAELSLGRSRKTYRSVGPALPHSRHYFVPQQDWETNATCCGVNCGSKPCSCINGIGLCSKSSGASDEPEMVMLADTCESTDGKSASACSCGCWADAKHSGCYECDTRPDPPVVFV